MIFISHHDEASSDSIRLTQALRAQALRCTAGAGDADTILLYLSPAYIAPGSPTIADAGRFLHHNAKLVIVIFGRISVREIRLQAKAPGWDEKGILSTIVNNMGIDMKGRGLSYEQVAKKVKDQLAVPMMTTSPKHFDIFLSHAGEDKHFVRVLMKVLGQRYRCFLDEESLEPGNLQRTGDQQLLWAARTARLGLFVLSDRSIKKWWPLKEVRIFQQQRIPIIVVWYQFLREQAEQYVNAPPPDLLQMQELGAKEFLQAVLHDPSIQSIHYPGHAWNNPDKDKYAHHIQSAIDSILSRPRPL